MLLKGKNFRTIISFSQKATKLLQVKALRLRDVVVTITEIHIAIENTK